MMNKHLLFAVILFCNSTRTSNHHRGLRHERGSNHIDFLGFVLGSIFLVDDVMTFVGSDPPSGTGKSNTWLTPLNLVQSLGKFDLDPCGYPGHPTATRLVYPPGDGLTCHWSGRVWLNPPYGNQAVKWLERLNEHGNGIAIVFNRLDTKWLLPFTANGFFAMTGRVQFIPTIDGIKRTQPGVGSLLIPFGKQNVTAIKRSGIPGAWFKMRFRQ